MELISAGEQHSGPPPTLVPSSMMKLPKTVPSYTGVAQEVGITSESTRFKGMDKYVTDTVTFPLKACPATLLLMVMMLLKKEAVSGPPLSDAVTLTMVPPVY